MLLSEGKDKVIKLINQYSVNGTVTPSTNGPRQDINNRMNILFDMAQKEVATVKKIHKVYKIIQNPLPGLLSNPLYSFDIVPVLKTEKIYSAVGATAYTFKVDSACNVYVEEKISGTWTELEHITPTDPTSGFSTAYQKKITASSPTNEIRLRFSVGSPYNIRDVMLWDYNFSSNNDIPQYQRYNQYPMPSDFLQFNKLVLKGNTANSQPYLNTADFFWENPKTLALNYYNVGEYNVFYYALPTDIDESTLDSYAFEVSEDAAQCLPYNVAGHLLLDDFLNKSVANTLLAIYQGKLNNLDTKITNGSTSVENTLFMGTSTSRLF